MVKLPIMSPGAEDMGIGDFVMNCFLCVINGHILVVKHLRYHRFNHVVPVNRICVIMSC